MLYHTLLSGMKMPLVGLGTWQSKPDELINAVIHAVKVGYRHFDTAYAYQNEADLGTGLKRCFDDNIVKREDLFVTSKLWNIYHHPDDVRSACKKSLELLGLDYLDMYLIHWPMGYVNNGQLFPKDENGKFIYSDVDFMDTWKAMEKLVDEGLVRNIGLSNFNEAQIQRVWDNSRIKPSCLQVECNPYLQQKSLRMLCAKLGIAFTGYSPFGNPRKPWSKDDDPKVLEDPVLIDIGKQHKKSPAQVSLRFQVQSGIIVIPKSVTPSRIEENFNVLDFELSDKEMQTIEGIEKGYRGISLSWVGDHKDYPF